MSTILPELDNPWAPDGFETPDERVLNELAEPAVLGISLAEARIAAAEDVIQGRRRPLAPVDRKKADDILDDIDFIMSAEADFSKRR